MGFVFVAMQGKCRRLISFRGSIQGFEVVGIS